MGRPFLYALGVYGTERVIKVIQCKCPKIAAEEILNAMIVLSDEIETAMRLLGVISLSELNVDHVNAMVLERELPRRLSAFPSVIGSKL